MASEKVMGGTRTQDSKSSTHIFARYHDGHECSMQGYTQM